MVKLNRILNKVIKAIYKALLKPLVNIITFYLYKDKLLNYSKVIIIVVLKKINKKNYSLLGSY